MWERRAAWAGAPAARAWALGRGSLVDPGGPRRSAAGVGTGTAAAGSRRDRAGVPRRDGGTRGCRRAARRSRRPTKHPLWHANAHQALGVVLTYEGDASGAIAELRKALRHWTDADLPFETAQARRYLAMAHRANGDEASAVMELQAAHATFERLGAMLEAARCLEAIDAGAPKAGRRVARTFMFTDIVGSTNLLETIGDDAWEDVVRWHDETLRSAIESHAWRDRAHHRRRILRDVRGRSGRGIMRRRDPAAVGRASTAARIRPTGSDRTARGRGDGHGRRLRGDGRAPSGTGRRARRVRRDRRDLRNRRRRSPSHTRSSNERAVSLKGIARPVRVVSIDWRA